MEEHVLVCINDGKGIRFNMSCQKRESVKRVVTMSQIHTGKD